MTKTTHNVDQAEIGKFEELAARWWNPESEFKPLHDINPLRLDYIDQAAGLNGKETAKKSWPRKARPGSIS